MRCKKIYAAGLAAAITGFATLAVPNLANAHNVAAEIEKVRVATEKYNDVNVALAEGFVPAPPGHCITAATEGLPPEWGGMGIHYINPKMLKITATQPRVDGQATHTDFLKPSILLYEPRANGTMKLVGVENLVFLNAWHAAGNAAPPSFAGRSFDTMADNTGTENDEAHQFQPHHDQHVYFAKSANPMDQLRPFSPSVTCEHFKGAGGGK